MEKVIIFSIFGFLFSFIGTKYLKEYLEGKKIFDIPNKRSSHIKPIPKGGGWIIVILLMILLTPKVYEYGSGNVESYSKNPFVFIHFPITVLGLAILSWNDDIKNINPFIRLFFQFFIILYSIALIGLNSGHTYSGIIILSLMVVWFINVFNFMDGIDGITPSIAITILTGYLIAESDITSFGFYSIIFCCLGFLFWNWHPAKIFLGDVGSVILGYICILVLIMLVVGDQWEWGISLPMYYILDTSITLINRFISGEKIWQAHNEHFYQKAVRSGMSHSQVVSLIITLQTLIIATCYFIENPYLVVFLAFLESTGLIIYFSSKYKKST
jgi:UDP-N-acetylmuramyl pentapeptide phosphotransferase/UDP-N-acetylglucosamine-1-phosphate transferase